MALSYFRQYFPRLAGEKRRITLGEPQQYPVDTYTYVEAHELYVYRDHEGIRAVTAVCTHLGCILEKSTDGFECPCHGSCYNNDGEVLSGPAPRNLSWFQVTKSAQGKIIVDPGNSVKPGHKFLTS
jgi:cytochrome b6-f complex iron-sulfur subunit